MVVLDNVLPVCIKVLSSCKKTGKKDVCCCSSVPVCLQSVDFNQHACLFSNTTTLPSPGFFRKIFNTNNQTDIL